MNNSAGFSVFWISCCTVFYCILIVNCDVQTAPQDLYNCTGNILIKDSEGNSYEFFENNTEVTVKDFHEATYVTAKVTGKNII